MAAQLCMYIKCTQIIDMCLFIQHASDLIRHFFPQKYIINFFISSDILLF